jgi:hypothetical protein
VTLRGETSGLAGRVGAFGGGVPVPPCSAPAVVMVVGDWTCSGGSWRSAARCPVTAWTRLLVSNSAMNLRPACRKQTSVRLVRRSGYEQIGPQFRVYQWTRDLDFPLSRRRAPL